MNESGAVESTKKYSTSNQVIADILQLLGSGDLDQAAQTYANCQEDVGYIVMAKAPRDRPTQVKLARLFFNAKDYEKAALVLEANDEYQKAAELYERTDQHEHAAEMWEKVGDLKRAALNYEKCGQWQTAADLHTKTQNYARAAYCFEKAVNHYLAGKYYYQLKKYQKSMELLQKVAKEDSAYIDAAMMIGNILAIHGYIDVAVQKYLDVTRALPLSAESVGVYYNLAKLYEKSAKHSEALNIYRQITRTTPGYKDVADRLRVCENEVLNHPRGPDEKEEQLLREQGSVQAVSEEVLAASGKDYFGVPQPKNHIVSIMDGFEFLKGTNLFEKLSLTEMKSLYTICDERIFRPGQILIEQFVRGTALFIIKKGSVVVQKVDGEKVTDLVTLGPEAYVGEMSLVSQQSTSARVIAGPNGVETFVITRDKFDELISSDDKIAIKIYQVFIDTLCERLRKTSEQLAEAKK